MNKLNVEYVALDSGMTSLRFLQQFESFLRSHERILWSASVSYYVRCIRVRISAARMSIYLILKSPPLMPFRLDFTWPDQNKRQVSLPASTYIDYVMSWVQRLLEDESVFPTKSGRSRHTAPTNPMLNSFRHLSL